MAVFEYVTPGGYRRAVVVDEVSFLEGRAGTRVTINDHGYTLKRDVANRLYCRLREAMLSGGMVTFKEASEDVVLDIDE